MEQVQYDWFVIIIAAILYMLIGAMWYSQFFFGKAWMKLSKITDSHMEGSSRAVAIFWTAVNALVIAFFLSFFEGYLGVTTVSDGMFVGFAVWLGFVLTTQASYTIWGHRPFKLLLIDAGSKLLSYIVMGGIIGA